MGAINEIDIAKLVLLPAVLYVAKKIIDWAGKVISSPPAKRKIRFEKVPLETKIEVLNKIAEIANADIPDTKLSRTHQTVQMKFLYEQIGITLPVWHAHQLIAFIADKNIGSYDVRLMSFLKNPSFYRCEENHFSVDAKKIKNFHIVSGGVLANFNRHFCLRLVDNNTIVTGQRGRKFGYRIFTVLLYFRYCGHWLYLEPGWRNLAKRQIRQAV